MTAIHGAIFFFIHYRLNLFERHHRAYDGDRAPGQGKWGDGSGKHWSYGMPWKAGDTAGFACDLDLENSSKTITFYLNGKSMGVAFSNVDFDSGLSPAMTVQVCIKSFRLVSQVDSISQGRIGKTYVANFGPHLKHLPANHRLSWARTCFLRAVHTLGRPVSDWIDFIGSSYLDAADGENQHRRPCSLLMCFAVTEKEEGILLRSMSAQPT